MHNKVFRGSCFWRSSRRNENWFFFRPSSSCFFLKKRTLLGFKINAVKLGTWCHDDHGLYLPILHHLLHHILPAW